MLAALTMPDSRKTPPLGSKKPPRLQSQDERDEASFAARRARELAAPSVEVHDEITGNLAGDDLKRERAKRPTDERIGRLEDKHDALVVKVGEVSDKVSDTRESVAKVHGKLEAQDVVMDQMLSLVKRQAEHAFDREKITLTVDKEAALAKIEVGKETELDKIKARRDRRRLIFKVIVVAAAATAALVEAAHRIGG